MKLGEIRKFSASLSRPDFLPEYWRYLVTLNGEIVRDCIFADMDKGEVIHMVVGIDGAFLPNEFANGPKLALLKGEVKITKTSLPLDARYSPAYLRVFSKQHRMVLPH